ncbi:unnamed protein product [Alopecurus aequalis]
MKTSSPLVTAALVLLLTVATVQGIRLDGETHAALSSQVLFNKSGEEVAVSSSGEVEESISEEDERAGHRRPENEIHVDYYGPRGHIPSHN